MMVCLTHKPMCKTYCIHTQIKLVSLYESIYKIICTTTIQPKWLAGSTYMHCSEMQITITITMQCSQIEKQYYVYMTFVTLYHTLCYHVL